MKNEKFRCCIFIYFFSFLSHLKNAKKSCNLYSLKNINKVLIFIFDFTKKQRWWRESISLPPKTCLFSHTSSKRSKNKTLNERKEIRNEKEKNVFFDNFHVSSRVSFVCFYGFLFWDSSLFSLSSQLSSFLLLSLNLP